MNFSQVIGQTLDEKYRIERELGRGGMGTVYLATHLGIERPVAVKIIAPQFMKRPEFVERFRREARAAGRLRHPNVVDVTDFGFAQTNDGQVAYLVMEYLDGCTLGEILEEEKNLPVGWTLNILEQVCSAVHEAHEQGIIHRDLKPDNIWLEPNQRGGYTVKVLDFGIAKLEEHVDNTIGDGEPFIAALPTLASTGKETFADHSYDVTVFDEISQTKTADKDMATAVPSTLIQGTESGSENATYLMSSVPATADDQETIGTRIISNGAEIISGEAENKYSISRGSFTTPGSASDLTRVGAVLGTPLYMSPEQCRGDKLDARSDIYSLGVIAYQMLSGSTPFTGHFEEVMSSHKEVQPPPLDARKVRRKLKRVIGTALSKNPDERPQTAEAFASTLQSRSEGIFGLLRRAAMIYSEHMPKFVMLSAFFHLPMIVITFVLVALSFLKVNETVSPVLTNIGIGVSAFLLTVVTAFCAHLITGTITWIVTQSLAVPLRPIRLRSALIEARKKWKTFAGTGVFATILSFIIAAVFFIAGFLIPFLVLWAAIGSGGATPLIAAGIGALFGAAGFFGASVFLILVTPVVMMENMRGRQALKRSFHLVRRSTVTAFAAFIIMFLIPIISAGGISFVVNMTAKALDGPNGPVEITKKTETEEQSAGDEEKKPGIKIGFGNNRSINLTDSAETNNMQGRLKHTVLESLLQILLLPIQILVTSFTAIIIALLYMKTRQAGGESMQDLLGKFEETEQHRKKWQERVRQRLIQSGRITSKPS